MASTHVFNLFKHSKAAPSHLLEAEYFCNPKAQAQTTHSSAENIFLTCRRAQAPPSKVISVHPWPILRLCSPSFPIRTAKFNSKATIGSSPGQSLNSTLGGHDPPTELAGSAYAAINPVHAMITSLKSPRCLMYFLPSPPLPTNSSSTQQIAQ
ncbi:hypothetical protein GQ43DRAFT_491895 [Delitschia confertaspora ATCC 74209]|uniref:Uncharacterized protein n=1 Tax=Delitschia confertaspora ATCC 74209 TaxID=1513339 RepID=A0A9P4JX33_9PLEO|nr:hypothetical protein GQ43DRAFT_491895 [Delitschia confertaspora ATCC 74209]